LKINSYLTILATFGALFPPLAIIACLTIFIVTYFEELSIGWLLTEARAKKYFWYEEQLNREAENVEKSSNFTLWSTVTVSSFFYGYIVFDTMGDTAGWRAALPMSILMFSFPLLLYAFIAFSKCPDPNDWRNPSKFFVDRIAICRSNNQNSSNDHHSAAARSTAQIELKYTSSKEQDNDVTMVTNPVHDEESEQ
jgi:MFS family permease